MTAYRAGYRSAVRTAITGSAHFADCTILSAWATSVDPDTLPVFGVATPRETKLRDSMEGSERTTTVMVALKRAGRDDLEDILDADSAVIEGLILGALDTDTAPCLLTDTSVEIDGGGIQRIGTLIMTFTVTAWLAEPLADA